MAKTTVWRGARELLLQPDYPEYEKSPDSYTLTLVYSGPFETCLASDPDIGSRVEGYPAFFYVSKTKIKHADGGRGVLTVVCETANAATPSTPENFLPQFEIECIAIDKPLAEHEKFNDGKITDEDFQKIQLWLDESDLALSKEWKFSYKKKDGTPGDGEITGTLAREYAKRIKRGQDSYRLYTTVYRLTTQVTNGTVSGGCGMQSSPGFGPASKKYIKTADRCNRAGKSGAWTRTQEWTGFDAIDEYLLPQ
ncbi:MAG: hypothetical protein LBD30_03555 [Verrucomicrobiales bacterium]|jgi:hypothetical protein|nr:hypothetical protein [Verrucomicrobiales bacterium]